MQHSMDKWQRPPWHPRQEQWVLMQQELGLQGPAVQQALLV
jgi:hypothetical protein